VPDTQADPLVHQTLEPPVGHDLAAKLHHPFPHGDRPARRSPTGGTAQSPPHCRADHHQRVLSTPDGPPQHTLVPRPPPGASWGRPRPSPRGPPAGHGKGGAAAGVPVVAAFDFTPGGWWRVAAACTDGTLGRLRESRAGANTGFEKSATGNGFGPVPAITDSWWWRATWRGGCLGAWRRAGVAGGEEISRAKEGAATERCANPEAELAPTWAAGVARDGNNKRTASTEAIGGGRMAGGQDAKSEILDYYRILAH
jgi:hypothetical protein